MVAKWRLRLFWAAVLAIITALGVKSYLNSLQDTAPVVIAATAIPVRTVITADMLKVVEIDRADRRTLAKDAFTTKGDLVGRVARRNIEEGEILRNRAADLTAKNDARASATDGAAALTDFIPANARAETVKVDQQAVLGGHLQKGDRVDVVFTSKSDSTGGVYASMLLQQVEVLDVERPPKDQPDKEVLVTLLVTPSQAVDLSLAKRTGEVDLILNPPDSQAVDGMKVISPLKFTGQIDTPPVKSGGAQAAQSNKAAPDKTDQPPGH